MAHVIPMLEWLMIVPVSSDPVAQTIQYFNQNMNITGSQVELLVDFLS